MKIVVDTDEIEVVIRIPKKKYDVLMETGDCSLNHNERAIKHGAVLPKGHGDLVDRKQIIEHGDSKGFCDWYEELKYAPTIIEANKESE